MQSTGCRVVVFGKVFGPPLSWAKALRSWRRQCGGVIPMGMCLLRCLVCVVGSLVVWVVGVISFFG